MILKDMVKPLYRFLKYVFLKVKYVFLCKNNCVDNFLKGKEDFSLFITHSLGGGTFQYEKNYIKENLEKKILILRIFSYGKDLCYRLENKESEEELYISPSYISKVFDNKFKEIIINSLIQIYDLFSFIDLLLEYKTNYPEILYTYHVHDFHCVCPIQNLVANDWYCELCCAENNCVFDKFECRYDGLISNWREKWSEFLSIVDKILCFSYSSKDIILKTYMSLINDKIIVRPHSMDYCQFSSLEIIKKSSLKNIAIVGNCNTIPKGKLVIEKLLELLSDNINIFIIGSTFNHVVVRRKNVFFYGSYKHTDLPQILKKINVDLIVFPSICPETFSFVVSELIQMEIPIVSFNIGAQGEKVNLYKKGIVCENIDDMIQVIENYKGK